VLRTAFYFIPSAMTGSIVSVFSFRNRVSAKEAFEGLELGEGKLSRPVLRGPGGRKAAWLLGSYRRTTQSSPSMSRPVGVNTFLFSCLWILTCHRAASVAILPSAVFSERFSLAASWASSIQ